MSDMIRAQPTTTARYALLEQGIIKATGHNLVALARIAKQSGAEVARWNKALNRWQLIP